jgi:hypothetical protein
MKSKRKQRKEHLNELRAKQNLPPITMSRCNRRALNRLLSREIKSGEAGFTKPGSMKHY